MSNEEKKETAYRKKEEGNLLYKNQKYQRAAKKYKKVIHQKCYTYVEFYQAYRFNII